MSLYKKVYLPIEVPDGDYCSKCDGSESAVCQYLDYEGAAILCGLKLGDIFYDNEKMSTRKCQKCLQLKETLSTNKIKKYRIKVNAEKFKKEYFKLDIPDNFETDAWCVGGEEGIMAIFPSICLPHCFMIAGGDDGNWWLKDECSPYWIPEIIEMYETAYSSLIKLIRKTSKRY